MKPGLYLVPSDTDLRVGVRDGYNNLQIVPPNAKTEFQPTINSQTLTDAPTLELDDFESTAESIDNSVPR